MITRTLPVLPGCGRVASVRLDVYSAAANIGHDSEQAFYRRREIGQSGGTLYGALDATVYGCDDHAIEMVSALSVAGFTPVRVPSLDPMVGKQCGDRLVPVALAAPEPAIVGTSPTQDPYRHTPWCARMVTDEGSCEESGWCGAGWVEVAPPGSADLVEVLLHGSYNPTTGDLFSELTLRACEFGTDEQASHALTFDQADMLAAVLVSLASIGRSAR